MKTIAVESPAKLNIGLQIVGRRENGYHELESLFWPISLCDSILFQTVEEKSTLKIHKEQDSTEPSLEGPQNLIFKALHALEKAHAITNQHWKIELKKKIPIGGGLGGGSSNAGATLRTLASYYDLSHDELPALALTLGADVPFFLQSKPAWVSGIGEKISAIELPKQILETITFLLIVPPFGIETKKVFESYQAHSPNFSLSKEVSKDNLWSESNFFNYLKEAKNDLEPHAKQLFPSLVPILEMLQRTPSRYAGLSGSGSTCFALFDSCHKAEDSLKALNPFLRKKDCRGLLARTFSA